MKTKLILFTAILLSGVFNAQQMKEYSFGQPFTMSYPAGYVKTYDLNDVAAAQFSSPINEKYSVVIQTEKDNLMFYQVDFSSLKEAGDYYSTSIKNGLIDDASLKYISPKELVINNHKAVEMMVEGKMADGEANLSVELFYHITVVETANYYYQIISWCTAKDKDKNLEEFRKIAKSFKEGK